MKHPHATVLTSEAFSAGMIRSATDYEVFAKGVKGEAAGMQGFDLAFYENRAYYHTPRDSISGMGHGKAKEALWAMLETVRGSGLGLLNDAEPGTDASASVYFDSKFSIILSCCCAIIHACIVFGKNVVVFKQSSLYAFNIGLLVLGPLVTIGLITWVVLASKKRSSTWSLKTNQVSQFLMALQEQNPCPPPAARQSGGSSYGRFLDGNASGLHF